MRTVTLANGWTSKSTDTFTGFTGCEPTADHRVWIELAITDAARVAPSVEVSGTFDPMFAVLIAEALLTAAHRAMAGQRAADAETITGLRLSLAEVAK